MNGESLLLFPELAEAGPAHTTGILPSQALQKCIESGYIFASSPITSAQIQPCSVDLRLSGTAYRVRASFLAGEKSTVRRKLDQFAVHEFDISKPAVLERGCVYIVPLQEELNLPQGISGKANPKSTTGRLDIFTRLITDYGEKFEFVPAGYKGKLYAEIVPRTFSVLVREGARLNQLRLVRGSPPPSDRKLVELHEEIGLVYLDGEAPPEIQTDEGLQLTVDLEGTMGSEIVGYRAKKHAPLIDLEKINHYEPLEFWDPLIRTRNRELILDPEHFYILASKERVRIPPTHAAEMIPYDPSVGELRIHYAGFFDPGFGYGADDIKGTHAVLEVRSHEVPFLLEDGQTAIRLVFERLLEPPERMYGVNIGSSYQGQGLALSKQFKR